MVRFIYFTFIVLLILGVLLIVRGTSGQKHTYHCDCDGEHSYPTSFGKSLFLYLLFIIPITTGFLFPNSVLDSSVALNRTIKLGASSHDTKPSIQKNSKANFSSNTSKNNFSSTAKSVFDYQPEQITESKYNALKKKFLNSKIINIEDQQYVNMMNIIQDNPKGMIGKTITTKGFVYREKNFL
jgi:uncharacterized repeat protein (TIGR03943 family)